MAALSTEMLLDEDERRHPSLHRSRSGGYADHLEEKTKWDRQKKEEQMKRYHESRYGGGATTTPQPRTTADRLTVPVVETNTRRNRSSSDVSRRKESPSSRYNVQEVRPRAVYDYDLNDDTPLSSQLPVRHDYQPPTSGLPQRKPSIKVEIHQDTKPLPRLTATPPAQTSTSSSFMQLTRRSPNGSPRSPFAQPQLLYQYSILQNKLSQITTACSPYLKVEPANPHDLTFSKISDQVQGLAFDLQVWSRTVGLENMTMIDSRKRDLVEAAARNLDRMIERVEELNDVCLEAKPRDLKLEALPTLRDDQLFEDTDDDLDFDITSKPAFIMYSCLDGIELHMGNLKRLTRSLQEATPNAEEEVMGIERLIEDISRYFGSKEALARYNIDDRFAGGKALEEARYGAAR